MRCAQRRRVRRPRPCSGGPTASSWSASAPGQRWRTCALLATQCDFLRLLMSSRAPCAARVQAGQQIVAEKEAAWHALLAAGGDASVHGRLADFLLHAVAERKVLVENMLAAQHAGEVDADTVAELRTQEVASRLRLMRSLLHMGQEVAAAGESDSQQALRATWLHSVNSLLAIDEVQPPLPPLFRYGL